MEMFTVVYKRPRKTKEKPGEYFKDEPLRTEDFSKAVSWLNAGKEAGLPWGELFMYVERDDPTLSQYLYTEFYSYEIPTHLRRRIDKEGGLDEDENEAINWEKAGEKTIRWMRGEGIKAAVRAYKPNKKTLVPMNICYANDPKKEKKR